MKTAVTIGIAALLVIAVVLFLRKSPSEVLRPAPKPVTPMVPEEVRTMRGIQWEQKPATAAEVPPDPRLLLADLAKALRNGDEKTARELVRRLHELLYPPILDDQNGALLYQKAFDVAREKLGGLSMKGLDPKIYSDLLTSKEITPEQRAALRAWYEQNGPAATEVLTLLREAGQRPQCRFTDASAQQAMTRMSYACNFLRLAAMETSNPDHALAGLDMARAVRISPNLISQMLGCAFDAITLDGLQGSGTPAAPPVAAWLDRADPAAVRDSYLKALLGDVDSTASSVLNAPKDAPAPLTLQNLAAYVEGIDDFARLAGRPYFEVREQIDTLARQHGELAPWYATFSQGIAPSMPGLSRAIARSEANASMAKLSLDLERYREKSGSYPATLDALATAPARDPFTGQPFAYRREGGGFVIESPGDGKKPLTWTRR